MNYRSLLVLGILCLLFKVGLAQQTEKYQGYLQNFTTHSATAFAFSKIDNIPMNAFTGRASINLPLFEKKMSILNFSMALNYTGMGGIKRSDPSSIVGKGWLLNVGGTIIRNKRGVPDDYKNALPVGGGGTVRTEYNGILYNNGVTYKPDGDIRVPVTDPTNEYGNGKCDSQHDIFEFNIFGKSGKFYIGKNKEVLVVTDTKLKIIPDFTNSTLPEYELGSFLIIDEAGVKYYFNQTETSIGGSRISGYLDASGYYFTKEYATSWLLTKVEAPFGEETITYDYIKVVHPNFYSYSSIYSYDSAIPKPYGEDSGSLETVLTEELGIKSITFSDQTKINFDYFVDRSNNPPRLLKKIDIISNEQEVVKQYWLKYKSWSDGKLYYTDTASVQNVDQNPYLNAIDLAGSIQRQTIYAFDYFLDVTLNEQAIYNSKGPNGADYWGYFNGKINDTQFLLATRYGAAADRSPDLNYAKLGVLKKIIYPTGGSEEFEYELNDKRSVSSNVVAGGIRIKKRILHDGISVNNDLVKEYKYVEVDGISSGFLGDQPEFTFIKNLYYNDGGWPSNPHVKSTVTTSFAQPANPLSNVEGSFVGYRRVEELLQSGNKSNGKIVYEYSDLSYTNLWNQTDYYPYRPVDRPYWVVGLPLKLSYYSSTGALTKQTVNEYNLFQQKKIDDNYRSLSVGYNGEIDVSNGSTLLRFIFKIDNYYPVIGRAELKTVNEFNYQSNTSVITPTQVITQNSYDANYFMRRSSSKLSSKGETLKEYFYYPFDYNLGASSVTSKLTEKNMINQPMLIESWILKPSNQNYLVKSSLTEYKFLGNGIIRPSKIYTAKLSEPLLGSPGSFSSSVLLPISYNFKPEITFNTYDNKNRLVEFENKAGLKSAIIFDKFGNVLAKADNSPFKDIAYSNFDTEDSGNWIYVINGVSATSSKSGKKSYKGTVTRSGLTNGNYDITLWAMGSGNITVNGLSKTINGSWTKYTWNLNSVTSITINTNGNLIDDLSLNLQDAQMTTFGFDKAMEIANSTDIKGKSSYFEYDEFNRLKNIKDQDNNIINNYNIRYKAPFLSASKSGNFTKEIRECPQGQVPGPAVNYIVPSGKYTSIISQTDADAQAQSDLYLNGQKYANENGICIPSYFNVAIYASFTKACPAGTIPSTMYYIVPEKRYSSIISQADADSKAQADVDANGQNYVNTNGTCADPIVVSLSNSTSATFVVSFDGLSTQYNFPPGSSSITIPSGVYTVNISPTSSGSNYRFYVGGRTAITGVSATFTGMNVTMGSGGERNIGVY